MQGLFPHSDVFGLLRESSEMIVSSSKIPALPGYKSHAFISEKVGRCTLLEIFREKWKYLFCVFAFVVAFWSWESIAE